MSSAKASPRRPFAAIGTRLTLWGTAITLGVCTLVCIVLYLGMSVSLVREVDRFLEGEIMEFRTILATHPGHYDDVQREVRSELGSRRGGDLTFRLLAADGAILLTSNPREVPTGPLRLPHRVAAAAPDAPVFETLQLPATGQPVRICSQWIVEPGGEHRIVQVSYLLDQVQHSLSGFQKVCAVALALAAVLALFGGRLLARRYLRPIDFMTAAARRIGVAELDERLSCSGNGDELDRLAATLNEMLARIEQQVRQIQQFTADASHEIRTPLAALRGSAEVALSHERSAEQLRRVIEESIDHYDRLGRIAEDLLLLARFDAGESILRREPVRLDRVVADVLDFYEPLASDRRIDLCSDGLQEAWLNADGGRLRQLVGNLIDNAIRYAEGTPRINVTLRRTGDRLQLVVADAGAGISPEHLPHVFDRFYRADRARTSVGGRGAGLGLSICRSIVEAHGGHIELESAPGRGTRVTIVLPGALPPPATAKVAAPLALEAGTPERA